MGVRHAIFTCSDANCGDFLTEHWAPSLFANVNTADIDVIVIDYGLTAAHRRRLANRGIILHRGVRNGHPAAVRFRDMARILREREYGQVMTCDGGDLIFQTDIRSIFDEHPHTFRAATEFGSRGFEWLYGHRSLESTQLDQLKKTFAKRGMINAGVLLAPHPLFLRLCRECNRLMKTRAFGSDQFAINFILHRDGFVELHRKYNFTITTSLEPFGIIQGEFYLKTGEKIPIVHNAGGHAVFRPVKNFGYGPGRNKLRKATFHTLRSLNRAVELFP